MSKERRFILIILANISIFLWGFLIYSVWTHEEEASLIHYESPFKKKEEKKSKQNPKK